MGRQQVYIFLAAILIAGLPTLGQAERFDIVDAEGFGQSIVAKTVEVPPGWQTKGRIAWNKPCSSNDLFETIFVTHAPNGLVGARIMPGYQFLEDNTRLAPGVVPDQFVALLLAQAEGFNRELQTRFRGSNCAVSSVADTQTLVNTLILKNRPADTRLIALHRDEAALAQFRNTFGAGLPGVRQSYDARIIELEYRRGSVPTTELVFLSWYNFVQEPIDMGGVLSSTSHTIVEPLRLVWAPKADAETLLPQVLEIFSSMRNTRDWQRRIDEIYRKNNAARDTARKERDAANDRQVQDFIDNVIWEGERNGSASTTPSETNIWGEPKTETDVWGEPKTETDVWGEPVTPETETETDFWGNPVEPVAE